MRELKLRQIASKNLRKVQTTAASLGSPNFLPHLSSHASWPATLRAEICFQLCDELTRASRFPSKRYKYINNKTKHYKFTMSKKIKHTLVSRFKTRKVFSRVARIAKFVSIVCLCSSIILCMCFWNCLGNISGRSPRANHCQSPSSSFNTNMCAVFVAKEANLLRDA